MSSIGHPSIVWNLMYREEYRQLYTFGEDGNIRVFTFDESKSNPELHHEYVEKANVKGLSNPDFTEEQLKKFPEKSKMNEIRGKKEGEVKVFVSNGKPEAYSWTSGNWVLIGEVVGGN